MRAGTHSLRRSECFPASGSACGQAGGTHLPAGRVVCLVAFASVRHIARTDRGVRMRDRKPLRRLGSYLAVSSLVGAGLVLAQAPPSARAASATFAANAASLGAI